MTYLALLRGINVGGHKIIKMAELARIFSGMKFTRLRKKSSVKIEKGMRVPAGALGEGGRKLRRVPHARNTQERFTNVSTYIQSGNVLFETPQKDPEAVRAAVERGLKAALAYQVTVVIRTPSDVARLASAKPFLKHPAATYKQYVAFLAETPAPAAGRTLAILSSSDEHFRLQGREVFVAVKKVLAGRQKFSNVLVEKTLGVPATTRNWSVVTALAGLLEA